MYPNPHGKSCPWYSLAESQGAPNIKWCEQTLCQWISEPYNSWSNLGYIILGFLLIYLSFKNRQSAEIKSFGPIILFMGLCSFFYHMSNFYGSQILDFVGMFLFVGWALGMNLIRLKKIRSLITFLIWFTLLNTLLVHVMYLMQIKFQILILLTGILILFTEKNRRSFWFRISIVLFAGAFGFSLSDAERLLCDQEKFGFLSHGHAIWHVLSTFAIFTLYKHYSSAESRLNA